MYIVIIIDYLLDVNIIDQQNDMIVIKCLMPLFSICVISSVFQYTSNQCYWKKRYEIKKCVWVSSFRKYHGAKT